MKSKFQEREFILTIVGILLGLLIMNGQLTVSDLQSQTVNELVDKLTGLITTISTIMAYTISRGLAKNEKRDTAEYRLQKLIDKIDKKLENIDD